MFPLYENTIIALIMLFAAGCMAVVSVSLPHRRLGLSVGLIILGLLIPWPIAFYLGLDHFVVMAAFLLGALSAAAIAAGSVWGMIAQRFRFYIPPIIVAVIPSLVISGLLLERQRIPDAACARHVPFEIGDIVLTVPRDAGLSSHGMDGAPAQLWEGRYGVGKREKPDVRKLCDVSKGGTEPVPVSHLWISNGWIGRTLAAECLDKDQRQEKTAFCAAIERTKLTVVQFYAGPDLKPFPSMGQFNSEKVENARIAGRLDGFECNAGVAPGTSRTCTIWQQVTPQILAVSSARLPVSVQGEDPVGDAAIQIRAMIGFLKK